MHTVQLYLFLLTVVLIGCGDEPSQPAAQPESSISIPADSLPQARKYPYPIIDTAQSFSSIKELTAFKENFSKRYDSIRKVTVDPDKFVVDSIDRLNADLFAYLILKHISKSPEHVPLLMYNIAFSTLVTLKDRLNTFNSLPEKTRNSTIGKDVLKRLQKKANDSSEMIGRSLSETASPPLTDSTGRAYQLSKLISPTHEYTLLIFSASWCRPCRYESIFLKNQLNRIDTSRLRLITISLDKSNDTWIKSIRQDACPWLQLITPGEFDSPLVRFLRIESIPSNILLNNQQQIVAKNSNVELVLKTVPGLLK